MNKTRLPFVPIVPFGFDFRSGRNHRNPMSMLRFLWAWAWAAPFWAAVALAQETTTPTPVPTPSSEAEKKNVEPPGVSDFIRFTEDETRGKLEVAIVRYVHPDGPSVDLIGALHVGDTAYYEELNKRFESYDALLYEMVGNPEDLKDAEKPAATENPLRMMQRMVKTMLKLDYQLDAIDYTKKNFVHADLGLEEFIELQDSRGENIFSLVQNLMRKSAEESDGDSATAPQFDLAPVIRALSSRDSASALKLLVAQQFDKAEELIDAAESDEDGTAILTGRNKHVMEVLMEQVAAGKKKLGVFFGAAHLVDLERRLREAGYRKSGEEWLTAWDIPKPQPAAEKTEPTEESVKESE